MNMGEMMPLKDTSSSPLSRGSVLVHSEADVVVPGKERVKDAIPSPLSLTQSQSQSQAAARSC